MSAEARAAELCLEIPAPFNSLPTGMALEIQVTVEVRG